VSVRISVSGEARVRDLRRRRVANAARPMSRPRAPEGDAPAALQPFRRAGGRIALRRLGIGTCPRGLARLLRLSPTHRFAASPAPAFRASRVPSELPHRRRPQARRPDPLRTPRRSKMAFAAHAWAIISNPRGRRLRGANNVPRTVGGRARLDNSRACRARVSMMKSTISRRGGEPLGIAGPSRGDP